MTVLLGLPGLYQHWMMSAIDPSSKVAFQGNNNFVTFSDRIKFVKKLEADFESFDHCDYPVINCYVRDENFVWYLYNFLEKTDGVGIYVDSLMDDLFKKATGTQAFDELFKHLISSYNLRTYTDATYCYNACIEYFYFVLSEKNSKFKTIASYHNDKFLNIEYKDFDCAQTLIDQLQHLPGFDLSRFDHMYQLLRDRNSQYLTRQQKFLSKLNLQTVDFDVLEWAYIGVLLYWQNGEKLDWFNPGVRQDTFKHQHHDICMYANKLL
jgi:hypothetical protein